MLINKIGAVAKIISEIYGPLTFRILEIGALPLEGVTEPFHPLLDAFPGTEIIAFEIDEKLCADLNGKAIPGLKYFPVALGRKQEHRALYETSHPMCTSLFKPNEELMRLYHNLDVAMLKSVGQIDTVSLDHFTREHEIAGVDFIKIDIQGAELDVFKGGIHTLEQVVAIVSEVEFIPLYIDQPLFGDVCSYLTDRGFMFHKFLGLAGRTIRPLVVNNDLNFAVQHMWADALFMRNIEELAVLPAEKLIKLGVLTYLYQSPDVSYHCFRLFDEGNKTGLVQKLFR